eukprot:466669_1
MGNQQTNSHLYCIGWNYYGDLGFGHTNAIKSLTKHPQNINVENVYCGYWFTIFRTSNNELYGCGKNPDGQCAVNNFNKKITKCTLIDYFSKINKQITKIFINSSSESTFWCTHNNEIYCNGRNTEAQLGLLNDKNNKCKPVIIHSLKNIKDIKGGDEHNIALDENGNVFGAGNNEYYGVNDKKTNENGKWNVIKQIYHHMAFRNVIHMVNITKRSSMRKKILSIPIGKPIDNNSNNEDEPFDDGLFDIFNKYADIFSPKKKTLTAYDTASYSDDLLIETILNNPYEISLITMGPLTNLYLSELKHPGILSLCADIYILGGEFLNKTGNSKNYALSEYNFNYDSNALYNIFNRDESNGILPNIFIFPLDATNRLKFGLQHISLLYTLLNNDIQTEIEMCRMKMEKEVDKLSGDDDDGYDESDLYESDRGDGDNDEYDDFQCTQTG